MASYSPEPRVFPSDTSLLFCPQSIQDLPTDLVNSWSLVLLKGIVAFYDWTLALYSPWDWALTSCVALANPSPWDRSLDLHTSLLLPMGSACLQITSHLSACLRRADRLFGFFVNVLHSFDWTCCLNCAWICCVLWPLCTSHLSASLAFAFVVGPVPSAKYLRISIIRILLSSLCLVCMAVRCPIVTYTYLS